MLRSVLFVQYQLLGQVVVCCKGGLRLYVGRVKLNG